MRLSQQILYGLHQIFTKMAADRISDGLGALVVEASAVATIALYLAALYLSHRWTQTGSLFGVVYSVVTGNLVKTRRDCRGRRSPPTSGSPISALSNVLVNPRIPTRLASPLRRRPST
jgi:hypothetical protein